MFKSRRALLAAGLTAAVIGAIGVGSNLKAGAEQIPGDTPSTTVTEVALAPPDELPWGTPPRRLKIGRDGSSAKALKAAGLSAAADASPESGQEQAPKGRTSRTTYLKSEQTTVVPPEPPAPTPGAVGAAGKPTVNFLYNVGSQSAVADGVYANLTISKPHLDKRDYHTLAELAVQSADGAQIVEVGWNVDRVVNGDDDPHLFVYHWVDRKTTCYNGCGFVQFSKNIAPGDTLSTDTNRRFGIQFFNGAWWIAYDTEWVGYFPAKLWDNEFTKSGLVQVFGEVAASSSKPCTEMGNGRKSGDDTKAAKIGSVAYLNGPAVDMAVRTTNQTYNVVKLSDRTFRYGGPGAC